jgi:hypothetical protein
VTSAFRLNGFAEECGAGDEAYVRRPTHILRTPDMKSTRGDNPGDLSQLNTRTTGPVEP